MAESPADLEALELDDLKRLVFQLLEENARLRAENLALREEIPRLTAQLKDLGIAISKRQVVRLLIAAVS